MSAKSANAREIEDRYGCRLHFFMSHPLHSACALMSTAHCTPGNGLPGRFIYLHASGLRRKFARLGHVAELADALDLGSNGVIRAGSTPVVLTILFQDLRKRSAQRQ